MAVAKWFGVLSTTESRNDVGIIKVRQGNLNSEIAEFQIIQNNKPYDLTGLTVYFCASFGLNLVEKPAVIVNTTGGKIQYTFDDDSMQSVGRQKGYFSIKKEESKIDSTQDFEFQVESSLMTRSIDGKSYIYKLSVLIKLLEDYAANGQENFDTWFESVKEILYGVDPGGNILRELIEARTTETGQTFNTLKARLNDFDAQLAQKASQLFVDTLQVYFENKISSVISGSPKGVYETYDELVADIPDGETGVYVINEDDNWYFWLSGFGWTSGGFYLTSGVSEEVKYEISQKVSIKVGKNIFDPAKATEGFYFDGAGKLVPLDGFFISDFIPVKPLTMYSLTLIGSNSGGAYNVFYKSDKKTIIGAVQGHTLGAGQIYTAPECYYMRLSCNGLSNKFISQVEANTVRTAFEPYTEYQPIVDVKKDMQLLEINKISVQIGKNLFNKDAFGIQYGKYMTATGALTTNELYYVSDYISVMPNTTYASRDFRTGGAYNGFFSKKLGFISGFKTEVFTTPTDCYFVAISGTILNMDTQQLELGSVATNHSRFTQFAPIEEIFNKVPVRDVITILPKKLYFVKNHQATIYSENVLLKNMNDNTTLFFSKGLNYYKQHAFKFDTAIKNQTMTAQIVRNLRKGESKTIEYDVVDGSINSGKTANVLFIGDSFTDIGSYIEESKNLLLNDGVNVNLIGTTGNGLGIKAEGLSGGNLVNNFLDASAGVARIVTVTGMTQMPSTAYPGRTYRDDNGKDWTIRGGKIDSSGNGRVIVTNFAAVESDFTNLQSSGTLTKRDSGTGDLIINYTNPVKAYFNPFINGSTGILDITNYINYWGFSTPDIVVFQFTWNDTGLWSSDADLNALVARFKKAVDHVHLAYPNSKIILSIEPFGSINGNKDWNGKKYTVLRLTELLLLQFEYNATYSDWVKIAPSYGFVDLVNGYSDDIKIPSERYTITEKSGGDGVHPNLNGMNQIADCIYPVMHHFLSLS